MSYTARDGQLLSPQGNARRRTRRIAPSTCRWIETLDDATAAGLLPADGGRSGASTSRPATCSGRASSRSGSRASARRPRRSAPATPPSRRTTSSRPTASTSSAASAVSTRSKIIEMLRGLSHGGWDAGRDRQLPPLHARDRLADPARHRLRDGHPVRRRAPATGDPDNDEAVIVYFGDGATSQGDVSEAFVFAASYQTPQVFFLQNNHWAISVPVERQSRTPLYLRATRLRHPERADRRQRRARQLRRHGAEPRRRPQRRAARASSRRSPTAWARTPRATTPPKYRDAEELDVLERARPDHPLRDVPARHAARATRSSPRSRPRREDLAADIRERDPRARRRRPAREDVRSNVYSRAASARGRRSAPGSRPTRPRSRGDRARERRSRCTHGEGASTPACARRMAADPKVLLMGEDIGTLGGVFRVTEGLQAEFGDKRVLDTPLAESGHRRHRDRPRDARLPAGVRDPVRRLHLSRLRPDHLAAREAHLPARGRRSRCPSSSGCRTAATSARSSTTRRAPRRTSRTPPACASSARPPRTTRYWMIQEAIASNDPVHVLRAEEPLLAEGRRRSLDAAASPLHASRVVRDGTEVTVVGHGAMVAVLLQAAEIAAEEGTSIEVIDLRSLSPIDYDADPRLGAEDRPPRRRAGGARLRRASAPRSRRPSPSARSTRSRRPCCGSAASTPRSRRPSSRPSTSPTPTASSRPSTARWPTDWTDVRS